MGFFSGIGKLFGGGTKVNQTATQKTTVNTQVDVENDIDISTEEIARVLAEFGGKTTELVAQLKQMNAVELITQLNFQDLIRRRTKQIGIIAGAFGFWLFFMRKKRK